METPLQITFRGMDPSEALEERVRVKTEKLETFYDGITSCRVVIEATGRHQQGNLYHVHIDVGVPGTELVVSREPDQRQAHEDAYVAVRDAFEAMARQVREYAQQQRGDSKALR